MGVPILAVTYEGVSLTIEWDRYDRGESRHQFKYKLYDSSEWEHVHKLYDSSAWEHVFCSGDDLRSPDPGSEQEAMKAFLDFLDAWYQSPNEHQGMFPAEMHDVADWGNWTFFVKQYVFGEG